MLSRYLMLSILGMVGACSPANNTTATQSVKTISYSCNNNLKIDTVYDNSETETSKVTLTIAGKQYALNDAVSASGARYTSMSGMTEGKAIEWWTKGDEGTLSEGPKDDKRLLEESVVVANCKQTG